MATDRHGVTYTPGTVYEDLDKAVTELEQTLLYQGRCEIMLKLALAYLEGSDHVSKEKIKQGIRAVLRSNPQGPIDV